MGLQSKVSKPITIDRLSLQENRKPGLVLEELSIERLAGIYKDFEDL